MQFLMKQSPDRLQTILRSFMHAMLSLSVNYSYRPKCMSADCLVDKSTIIKKLTPPAADNRIPTYDASPLSAMNLYIDVVATLHDTPTYIYYVFYLFKPTGILKRFR